MLKCLGPQEDFGELQHGRVRGRKSRNTIQGRVDGGGWNLHSLIGLITRDRVESIQARSSNLELERKGGNGSVTGRYSQLRERVDHTHADDIPTTGHAFKSLLEVILGLLERLMVGVLGSSTISFGVRVAYAFEHLVRLLAVLQDPLISFLLNVKDLIVYVILHENLFGVADL